MSDDSAMKDWVIPERKVMDKNFNLPLLLCFERNRPRISAVIVPQAIEKQGCYIFFLILTLNLQQDLPKKTDFFS